MRGEGRDDPRRAHAGVAAGPEALRTSGPHQDLHPLHMRDLKAGAHVDVLADDILDYLFYCSDATREGNETGMLMHGQR